MIQIGHVQSLGANLFQYTNGRGTGLGTSKACTMGAGGGAGASKGRAEPGSGASAPETEGESNFADPGRLAFAVSDADQARLPDALTW